MNSEEKNRELEETNNESQSDKQKTVFNLNSLPKVNGVKELSNSEVTNDLILHTKSSIFKVKGYFQLDNIPKWRLWTNNKDTLNSKDVWLFYACPMSMADNVFDALKIQPYDQFFPRIFGKNALYLFSNADLAARVSFRFGIDQEGLILSCRLITGKIYKAKKAVPNAETPPKGYDTVQVSKGKDLGSGPLMCDMLVSYNPDNILIRYVSYITNEL